ncbi:MAG: ferrochelatase [Acidobacteria bacterium]|nr:MAG: ferrochelatase [Acidobacteriota bacterium]
MKIGVLLFNLGGPETLRDVKPFLYRLFSDPEIVRIKWGPLRKALAYTIATVRRRTSEGYYRQIGGGSPLRRLTEEQALALARELKARGRDVETFVGMCTWHPLLEEAIGKIAESGVDRLVILPLFPQYSVTTTGSGFSALRKLIDKRPEFKKIHVQWISSWPDHPVYIDALVQAIQPELAKTPNPGKAHILFSAHSVPESYVRKGDPYLEQTKRTVELIMDRLLRTNPYSLSFQSKIGPVKWLQPFTNDVIVQLGKDGVDDVLVVPISFVSEHVETLYELDILYKKVAQKAGVENFRRVPALNSAPMFIRALADMVENALEL